MTTYAIPDIAKGATVMLAGRENTGTGFLVVRPRVFDYDRPEAQDRQFAVGNWRKWFVTCAHVIDEIGRDSTNVQIRLNHDDKLVGVVDKPTKPDDWTRHPRWDPKSERREFDVAVHPASIDTSLLQGIWYSDMQVTRQRMARLNIREGVGAYTMGYPVGWTTSTKDFPVVRFGVIAQMQPYLQDGANTFLMDGSVFPGNSGGPVFTFHPVAEGEPGSRYPHLIGMVSKTAVLPSGENAGLGVVTPVEHINEAMDHAISLEGG